MDKDGKKLTVASKAINQNRPTKQLRTRPSSGNNHKPSPGHVLHCMKHPRTSRGKKVLPRARHHNPPASIEIQHTHHVGHGGPFEVVSVTAKYEKRIANGVVCGGVAVQSGRSGSVGWVDAPLVLAHFERVNGVTERGEFPVERCFSATDDVNGILHDRHGVARETGWISHLYMDEKIVNQSIDQPLINPMHQKQHQFLTGNSLQLLDVALKNHTSLPTWVRSAFTTNPPCTIIPSSTTQDAWKYRARGCCAPPPNSTRLHPITPSPVRVVHQTSPITPVIGSSPPNKNTLSFTAPAVNPIRLFTWIDGGTTARRLRPTASSKSSSSRAYVALNRSSRLDFHIITVRIPDRAVRYAGPSLSGPQILPITRLGRFSVSQRSSNLASSLERSVDGSGAMKNVGNPSVMMMELLGQRASRVGAMVREMGSRSPK